MAYIDLDRTGGYPIELYKFESSSFATPYTYTSSDVDVSYSGDTYVASEISRTQTELSRETRAQQISVNVPRSNVLALRWYTVLPPKPIFLRIYRYHASDTPTPEVILLWVGKITGIEAQGNTFSFIGQPLDFALSRMGLRYNFGPVCSNQLYDSGCRVDPNNFLKTTTVSAISSDKLTITASGFSTKSATQGGGTAPANYWVPGIIERVSTGEMRSITNYTNPGDNFVKILFKFEELNVSDSIRIYPGCNHDVTPTGDCINKFNNLVNAKGYIYIGDNLFQKNILR